MSAPGGASRTPAPDVRAGPGRAARQVVVLAGATFREAVRMKAFAAPLVFAATAVAASPFLPSDGTAAGAVRLAVSVSLVTASIFGTFAAVMVPSLLAAREARDRSAYLVATKPVPRWSLFVGRALGVTCVMAAMFAGMAVLSWVFVRYTVLREPGRNESDRAEAAEVLVARATFPPEWQTGPIRFPVAGPREPVSLAPGGKARWRFSLPRPRAGLPGPQSGTGGAGRKLPGPQSGTGGAGRKLPGPQSGTGGAGRKLPGPESGTGGAGRKLPGPESGTGGAGRKLPGFEGRVGFRGAGPPRGGLAVRVIDPGTGEAKEVELVAPAPRPPEHDTDPAGGQRPRSFAVPADLVAFDPDNPRLPGTVDVEIENRSGAPVELVKSPPVVVLAGSYVTVPPGAGYVWEFRLGGRRHRRPAFRLTAHKDWHESVELTLKFRGAGGVEATRRVVLETRPLATVEIPPEILSGDGFVVVELRNESDSTVRFPARGGLVFAPASGTFAGALVRWTLLETSKAALIVIVTCAAATFLTFPVPALAGGALAVGGYLMTFVLKLLSAAARGEAGSWAVALEAFLRLLLPDFAGTSISGRIADGAFVPAGFVASCAALLVLVRGGLVGLVGAWLERRREVGA